MQSYAESEKSEFWLKKIKKQKNRKRNEKNVLTESIKRV